MSRLADVEVFVQVVETGSYTAAARALGISKSYASKQVRALEERLGTQLLHRTTRTLTPTDAGRSFAVRCAAVLSELDHAEHEVVALQERPAGTLRVTLPMSFGIAHVAPMLAQFMAQHPDLSVEAEFEDARVDLVEGGYDLAIRLGSLPDSSLKARRLAPMAVWLVASPAYLQRHGTPAHPDDLRKLDGLIYSLVDTPSSWSLEHRDTGEVVRVRMEERYTSNTGEALLAAIEAGVGIAPLPDFMIAEHVRQGRVQLVLPDWCVDSGNTGVWAVYPPDRHPAPKVTLFVEALAESLSKVSWDVGPAR